MGTTTLAIVVLLAIACGSGQEGGDMVSTEGASAKVRVYRDGRITLDDSTVSLDGLSAAFADLKQQSGSVWYYREGGDSEPHPNAMAVIQAIVEAKLPVSMSSEEDFSNVVLPDGTTRPRE